MAVNPPPPSHLVQAEKEENFNRRHVRAQLDERFSHHPKPSALEIGQLAAQVGLGKEVVRVWLCNRRQKEKRAAGSATTRQGSRNSLVPQSMPGKRLR